MIPDGVLVGAQVHNRGAWVLGSWDFLGSRALPADDVHYSRSTMRMVAWMMAEMPSLPCLPKYVDSW